MPAEAADGLAHHEHPARSVPEGAENYAKAVFSLEQRADGPVGTGAVADLLGVTAASASAMLRRLGEGGVVEHAPYHGVRLTEEGRRLALRTIRRHRLIELLLADVLGIPWDRVHRHAEVLEHHVSDEIVDAIAAKLGDPARDPHGDPIPDASLRMARDDTVSLSDLGEGDAATFVRVSDSDPEMLRYLSRHGIAPGDRLSVSGRQPFGGPLTVRFGESELTLGGRLADAMRVEPTGA